MPARSFGESRCAPGVSMTPSSRRRVRRAAGTAGRTMPAVGRAPPDRATTAGTARSSRRRARRARTTRPRRRPRERRQEPADLVPERSPGRASRGRPARRERSDGVGAVCVRSASTRALAPEAAASRRRAEVPRSCTITASTPHRPGAVDESSAPRSQLGRITTLTVRYTFTPRRCANLHASARVVEREVLARPDAR